jgi:hypothetical protein
MNSALHFLHIHCSDFHLKKKILPLNFEKLLWSNKFMKVPPCRNYFLMHLLRNGICFLWDLGLWILTIQPSHSYTLAYCRPIHQISIEFQNIDNDQGCPTKKLFFPLQLLWSCNPWGHFDWDFFYTLLA